MEQELRNVTDEELLKAMKVLGVNNKVTVEELKRAYQKEIRTHHTDKGGSVEAAKSVTTSYRLLKTCLETGRRLPSKSAPQMTTSTSSAPDGARRTGGHQPKPYKRQRVYPYYTVEDNLSTSFFFDW
ncbi:hypothetical protein AAVH_02691 [Aphelenchoides avenae]|nr:hypothetical protein AAVH_02691 [Aphelenchus avenae]